MTAREVEVAVHAVDVDEVDADLDVAVEDEVAVVVVVVEELLPLPPQSEELSTTDAGRRTLGNPDAIGTGISPLESTVTDVHVYASISFVPDV